MQTDSSSSFGALLRDHRRAAGLTQAELAERAGLSWRGFADLERGARRTPHRDTLARLVTALGLTGEERAALEAAARRPSVPAPALSPAAAEPAARPEGYSHLPIPPTPLLGREREVAAVAALLRRDDVRLVTLTGPAGVGKTRLGVQVAAEVLDDFPDGVWFVRLSRLVDPGLVVSTIAQTLGVKEAGSQPIVELLSGYLADRHLLLVLDNFEQVVGAAPEVGTLLATSPALRVLVTSRSHLHLRGEREYALAPLPLPEPGQWSSPERLSQYAAVALFVERAGEAWSDFAVTVANAPAIAAVCARLDGLPLAIELAAARVKLLPPEALLTRLSNRLLTGGARDLEAHQQTMRATIAWSEALLTLEEQALFRRLAVFAGGCTLEAAEAVCAAPDGAEPLGIDVLEGLGALVDHSLVQQREERGEPRYGMLHVIREYALEHLEAVSASSGRPPEAEALRRAHASYALALAERAEAELIGPEAGVWLDRLEREHDNLRAALGWARDRGEAETGLRLVVALWRFWLARGHLREGRAWVDTLLVLGSGDTGEAEGLARATSGAVQARAFLAAGSLAMWQGDESAARAWLGQATTAGQAMGDPRTAAGALNALGLLASDHGDEERAATRFAESLALAREAGDRRGSAVALGNLGNVALNQGDLERAAEVLTEALALYRQVGDRNGTAVCLDNLGEVARRRGEVTQAVELGREALALHQERGDLLRITEGLEQLACTAAVAGQGEHAARLLGAAAALRGAFGTPPLEWDRANTEQAAASVRAALGEQAWVAAFASGQAMTLEQAIAEALGEPGLPCAATT